MAFLLAFGCLKASKNLHENLLHQIMRLPMIFFDSTPVGRIINRFSADFDMVDDSLPFYIREFIYMTCIVRHNTNFNSMM